LHGHHPAATRRRSRKDADNPLSGDALHPKKAKVTAWWFEYPADPHPGDDYNQNERQPSVSTLSASRE
jgi:hypothetical protein